MTLPSPDLQSEDQDKCAKCDVHAHCENGKCVCDGGYYGEGIRGECFRVGASNPRFCVPNPCKHGGSCFEEPNGHRCLCASGYEGENCELSVGKSVQSSRYLLHTSALYFFKLLTVQNYTDSNQRKLRNHLNNHIDEIRFPFTDQSHLATRQKCDFKCDFFFFFSSEDKCAKCDVHAHCENGKCVCDGGYYGEGIRGECFRVGASNPRFCVPNPCKHGGSCFEEPNGHRCLCASGYEGENCELSVGAAPPSHKTPDPCAGAPCKNGGSCVPKGTKFQCLCSKGFQGPTCEAAAKSYCHPNPCLHGGKCIDGKNGYTCSCIGSYRGFNCEVDDCDQCDIHAICVQGACRCRVGYKGDGFECEKVKRCHHCSPNATCISNECVCKPGFIGNGKQCRVDNCQGCPPHSHCHQGICICISGFTFNGHRCVAVSPKPTASHCPAECGPASKCPLICPSHCCKPPEHHVVGNCPDICHLSCEPACPEHCCEQLHYLVPSSSPPTCPSECHTSCHQSCPIHCCKAPKPSANACPSYCQTSCAPSCPSQCCTAKFLPTVEPTQASCSSVCKTNCLPTCPKYCCNLKIVALSTCPGKCKGVCGPPCPMQCCSSLPISTQHPILPKQSCPSTCKANCLPSCPSYCCKISQASLTGCPSTCIISCVPTCPQHCCGLPYLPRSSASPSDVCPSQCAYHCDSLCPSHCCSSKPEQPPMQMTTGSAVVFQETNPTTPSSLVKPCPTYCSSFCTPTCPSYCCKRNELSPYLVKLPEETVSPFGRSLTDHNEEYKEKMIHHISELLSSPLTNCQLSCFSHCSDSCPKTCCDVRKKRKMYVFKRKKKTRITRPQTNE
ncbi:neurogenic locus notch homolog protein 2-like [Orbicella faveolata]|uniref:neurogenic locus notch homolog protein 2-like n=1 Tax=Orbicella faveolata TaxID=48498 RepID=UPI0009E51F6F|nr:neurogenic locus notch homolog protein 2-like [Orbicella faveolata]